jgi:hypothetical protein
MESAMLDYPYYAWNAFFFALGAYLTLLIFLSVAKSPCQRLRSRFPSPLAQVPGHAFRPPFDQARPLSNR